MTPYQRHRSKWNRCTACALCKTRSNVILARGVIPCEVLFIGEAPGASEDVLGKPFVGPAGKLLDRILAMATSSASSRQMAFTNLVACIPKGPTGGKAGEPPEESITACAPRLREFVKLCKPKLMVCVGGLAAKWVTRDYGYADAKQIMAIIHPAAILRMDVSRQGLAVQRTAVLLSDALEELSL